MIIEVLRTTAKDYSIYASVEAGRMPPMVYELNMFTNIFPLHGHCYHFYRWFHGRGKSLTLSQHTFTVTSNFPSIACLAWPYPMNLMFAGLLRESQFGQYTKSQYNNSNNLALKNQ